MILTYKMEGKQNTINTSTLIKKNLSKEYQNDKTTEYFKAFLLKNTQFFI